MAATVLINFESSEKQERYLVASSAVMEDRQGRYVFVVEPADSESAVGIIHRKKVEVGQITGEGLEILKGLKDGDRVVTAGVSLITEGQKVKI